MRRIATALLAGLALGTAAVAQTPGKWTEEFTRRPLDWGGDIRYLKLEMPGGQILRLGCTANRIERILVVFARDGNNPAPIDPIPIVRYAIDEEPLQNADWPLFESGSIEVPRGTESTEMTLLLTTARRFRVEATRVDGRWEAAEFDLIGIEWMMRPMLEACGIE